MNNRVNDNRINADSGVRVRYMTVTAMLSALAFILMFIDFSVPLMPSFIKMDISELPALIGAFAMGPVYGVFICLIKNLLHLFITTTGGVGELCNFMLGAIFVFAAGFIYQRNKNRKTAVLGALIGAALMAVLSIPVNYFITYPVYTKFMPIDAIISMYQEINPAADSLLKCLITFNAPFTFVKGLISVVITFAIYKRISPIIKGTRTRR